MSTTDGTRRDGALRRAWGAVERFAARIDLANTAGTLRATQTSERWLAVGQEVTTAMLEGADVEDALALIAARLRVVAEADAVCLVLPGVGDDWVIEIVDGEGAGALVGIVMPPEGRARRVLAERAGTIVQSFVRTTSLRVPQLGRYGPALYAPLVVGQASTGVILVLRAKNAPEFTPAELEVAESFARQAALALELATARRAQDRASLLDERARIARDLHDLAIQHLFATGLALSRVREAAEEPVATELGAALGQLDEAVTQIRTIVHALQRDATGAEPLERLHREVALARSGLGFAAELVLEPGASEVEAWADGADADLVDDVVAVVREGLSNAARHGHAAAVRVTVRLTGDELQIAVVDDGVGIPEHRERSSGLANLGRRAARWGGTVEVGRGGAGGTVLTWRVPGA